METERTLSSQELKRLELLKQKEAELEALGYEKSALSFKQGSLSTSLAALPFALLIFIPYYKSYGTFCPLTYGLNVWNMLLLLIGGIVILSLSSELIRGLSLALFAPGHFRALSMGLSSKGRLIYLSQPLEKWQFITASLMPALILGIIPGIAAIKSGSLLLLFASVLMILWSGGDILTSLRLLIKSSGPEALYIENPTESGIFEFKKKS